MKKKLLVTLATRDRIDWAKQLFSGAFFNGGWDGDYMLLSHEIPEEELSCFRNKGILIKKCAKIDDKKILRYHPCVLDKFYLFTPEFKKWDNVVYLDSDIFIRAPIDALSSIKGFAACPDFHYLLNWQFLQFQPKENIQQSDEQDKAIKELEKNYNRGKFAFNTGVMTFNTNIIKDSMFQELKELFEKYKTIGSFGEQLVLNLLFYNKWTKLPMAYNIPFVGYSSWLGVAPEKIKGIMIHAWHSDPKLSKNFFRDEMKDNLVKFDMLNIKKKQDPINKWSYFEIHSLFLYLIINQPKCFSYFLEMALSNYCYPLYLGLKKIKRLLLKRALKL
jgi:hypothetical protein